MEIIIALIIIIATSIIAIIMYLKAKKSKHNELSTSIQNKEIITKYNSIVNDNSEIQKQLEEFKYKYSSIINADLEIKKRLDEIQNKETAANSKLHEQIKKLEEQKELREQMREEEKVRKEADKAQKEAEKEERLYQKAFTEAQNKIKDATGDELEKLKAQLTEIKSKLEQAGNMKERAISMAQQTKAGHVYVISNIGSFGENVYKIGMTRRLEPLDRVKELGGASVPFNFDVHALIYSDNAPLLENTLHKEFHNRKVNLVNSRREFFNVSLEEIEKIVKENYGHIEFTKIAEAKEYRESIIIRKATTVTPIKEEKAYVEANILFN
ncbi:MAG: GIY-YIG nuclease family protein [Marinifilaceae bacterium]